VQTDAVLEKERRRYMDEMEDEQKTFLEHLNSINLEVNGLAKFTDLRDVEKASSAVATIKRQLEVRFPSRPPSQPPPQCLLPSASSRAPVLLSSTLHLSIARVQRVATLPLLSMCL
jgi:hypothetical protein